MIIGICGPARSGKDTAADYLISKMPEYAKASFADPMKDMLTVGLKLSNEQLYGDEKEIVDPRYGHTPRFIMQTIGTEWGRKLINSDVWVNAMAERVALCTIIPDVRFENEAKFCRKRGVLIHIDGKRRDGEKGIMSHESEAGILPVRNDLMVNNHGSLEDFYKQLWNATQWF